MSAVESLVRVAESFVRVTELCAREPIQILNMS